MLQPIDSNYMKFGAKTLIDLVKGDAGFGSGKWLGFHKNKMDCYLYFKKPVVTSDITLSGLVDIGSEIMPPVKIEVWGGSSPQNMTLLGHLTPEQPEKAAPGYLTGYDISFSPTRVSCIRITVTPVDKLPLWHPAKGKKGWIFFDEIFVN
jgi:hypothetical protein